MYSKRLRKAQHTRRFAIAPTPTGWEIREEQDSQVVKRVECHDWHRVERARRSFGLAMDQLQQAGWQLEQAE